MSTDTNKAAKEGGLSDKDIEHLFMLHMKEDSLPYATAFARAIEREVAAQAGQVALAQQPKTLREAFDKAFLSWNGFHTKAELDAEWASGTLAGEMFRAGAAGQVAVPEVEVRNAALEEAAKIANQYIGGESIAERILQRKSEQSK